MRKFHLPNCFVLFILIVSLQQATAQVNLPYTLHFSVNDAAAWSDGIAQDGDGGTSNINGLDLLIYAADGNFTKMAGSTMRWMDNGYYASGTPSYTALTPGPDPLVTNNGIQALVLKSSSQAVNFSLQSLQLYDWGGVSPVRMATYNNGTLVGSIDVAFDQSAWAAKTVSQADALTPALFKNIDEVRFYPSPSSGSSVFWLSLNNISLASAVTLPVTFTFFKGRVLETGSALLEWETAQEQHADRFEVEQSRDGVHFNKAGSVQAKGNSSAATFYQYTLTGELQNTLYLRLKQVDQDGRFMYSQIISLQANRDASTSVGLYPNPAVNGTTTIRALAQIDRVRVFSAAGTSVKIIKASERSVLVDLRAFPKGCYHLLIDVEGQQVNRLLVIQ